MLHFHGACTWHLSTWRQVGWGFPNRDACEERSRFTRITLARWNEAGLHLSLGLQDSKLQCKNCPTPRVSLLASQFVCLFVCLSVSFSRFKTCVREPDEICENAGFTSFHSWMFATHRRNLFCHGKRKEDAEQRPQHFPNATAHPCSSKNEDMKLLRGTSLVRWQHHYFYDGIVRENSFLGVRILAISIHKLMMFIVGSYSDLSPRWRSWIALDANCARIVWRWAFAEHTAFAKWRIFGNYSHNCFALQCLLLVG